MINLTVISMKSVIKYLVKVTFVVIIIVTITRYFCNLRTHKTEKMISSDFLKACINQVIPLINQKNDNIPINGKFYEVAIRSELGVIDSVTNKNVQDLNNEEVIQTSIPVSEEDENEEIPTNVATQVVESAYHNRYTNEYSGVQIKNETSYELPNDILNANIKLNKKNVMIFHTHTCESYTPSTDYQYQASGNYRTVDLNYSVARVGDELTNLLSSVGYSVYHDKTFHDYPSYNGSYGRSLKTIQNLLKTHPNTDVVVDLHRDAIGDNTYAPTVKIGEESVAQLMFVIGTNGSGLSHDNWQQNLKFAIKVQQKANELYPGLFKPIILRNSRYNQHLAKGACIIEVGATGNTMEQCLVSMKYLSKVMDEVMKNAE